MVTAQEIMEYLTGNGIAKELMVYVEQNFEDFSDVRKNYISALVSLHEELDETKESVQTLADAIEQQVASGVLFSMALGFKSNWDHFIDPMDRTVLDADFDVFLRENTAHRLSEYEQARIVIEAYLKKITLEENACCEAITEYMSYFETVGPKLAHFFGYLLGDTILCKIVPGYQSDAVLTMKYRSLLADYFGESTILRGF